MAGTPPIDTDAVKALIDPVALVGHYIDLRPEGREHVACCPFHEERTPSFKVNKNGWKCFGTCGKSGDVIRFVQEFENVDFQTAVSRIREIAGDAPAAPTHTRAHRKTALAAASSGWQKKPWWELPVTAEYLYTDEQDNVLFKVQRREQFSPDGKKHKDFPVFRPNQQGDWTPGSKNPDGTWAFRRVLYRLDKVISSPEVYLVEGEKDVHSMEEQGAVATTPPGGSNSEWLPEYTEALVGKDVIIIPDNDPAGLKRGEQLATILRGQVERLTVVKLPPIVKDVTDFFEAGNSLHDLSTLVAEASAQESPASAATRLVGQKDTNVQEVADEITGKYRFARDQAGQLFVYAKGVYTPKGEATVLREVKAIYIRKGLAGDWTSRKAKEVVEYIRVDAPELWGEPPRDRINVQNGILDVRTRKLEPHSPEFLSVIQLPVTFDPTATCPAWEKLVADLFPADSQAVAWELPAWIITPDTSIQKAALLLGEGANGKSTYLRGIVRFIGKQNTSGVSLHKLEQDRFAGARLVGKLANICPDLPSAHLATTSTFKALTGGDVVNAEYKYMTSFEFVPFAKMLFSANQPPRSDDSTHGFFRRWLVIPFTRCFEENGADTVPREELDARLATPSEHSGLLNKALSALADIRRNNRFSEGESLRQAWDEFRTATDPLSVWLDQNTVDDPEELVPKGDLIAAYNSACAKGNRPPMTNTAFGQALRRARPKLGYAQRTVNLRLQWCYLGIALSKPAEEEPNHASHT